VRIVGLAAGALLVLILAGLLALHAPPVRAYALRYASSRALEQGIVLEAERLEYNLVALRAALIGVRVSAVGATAPFFEADDVDVELPGRMLRGELAIDDVTITGGRVRVVRGADGQTNLPTTPESDDAAEPAPLPVARVFAPGLTLELRDRANDLVVDAPALTLDLSSAGRVQLDMPARVARGDTGTTVTGLAGELAFDGRDLRLDGLALATDEGRLEVDGLVALLRSEPSIDVRLAGEVDVARVARWGTSAGELPMGTMAFTGDVRGRLASPAVDIRLTSDRLAWNGIAAAPLEARARVDADRLDLSDLQVGFAEGRVTGRGGLAFATRGAGVDLTWRDVSVSAVVALVSEVTPRPSGLTAGELRAAGTLGDAASWVAETRVSIAGGRDTATSISLPGETSLALDDGAWRLDGRHRVGGVGPLTAALRGRLNAEDPASSPVEGAVRLPGADVAALLRRAEIAGMPSAREGLVEGTIDVDLRIGGVLGQPTVAFEAGSEALAVEGQPFVNVHVRGAASTRTVEVEEFSAEQRTRDGASPAGTLRGTGRYDVDGEEYEARAEVSGWRLESIEPVPATATVRGTIEAEKTVSVTHAVARLVAERTTWEGRSLGDVSAFAETHDGREVGVTLHADDFSADADVTVTLEDPFPVLVQATAGPIDVAAIRRFVAFDPAVRGAVGVRATAEGDLRTWREGQAILDVELLSLLRDQVSVQLGMPARLRYENERVGIEGTLEARIDSVPAGTGTLVRASGALPIDAAVEPRDDDGLRVSLGGDVRDLLRTVSLAGIEGVPAVEGEGPVAAEVQVAGSIAGPQVTASLDLGPASVQLTPELPPVTDLRARARIEDDVIRLQDLEAAYEGARILAGGSAPLALATGSDPGADTGTARLQGRIFDVTPAMLAPFVEPEALEQVEGSVDVTLDFTATSRELAGVSGDLILERFSLAVADLPVRQTVPTRIVVEDGVARVAAWDWQGEGASLSVSGQVGLVDRVAAIETDGSLDLGLLTPFVRAAGITPAGRLEPRLSMAGSLDEPSITGNVQLVDGAFRLADPAVIVDDLEAAAEFAGGEASLTTLRGTINGGSLAGSGRLQYAPDTRGMFTFDVAGMALNAPEGLRSEIDAALGLSLAPQPGGGALGGELSGTVTVTRSSYREPLALITGLLGNLRSAAGGEAAADSDPAALDRLALDVRVVTDDDLVIRNNVARAEVGADLRVIGTAASPSLSGRAELREGGQLFLGRNIYTVDTGTIDFANPVAIEPDLDIVASTRAGGEEIEVAISGTPDTLTRSLSSPSAPELGEADLTALLLTGRRMDELGSAQAAEVSAQVLGNLSGDVLGVAGRAVGLDTLRVGGVDASTTLRRDPADLAGEVDPTTRLTFGKTLGSDIDVTWSQSLRNADAKTWIVDYAPLRQIDLRLISDDEDLRTYAFRHDLTFGGPPRGRSVEAAPARARARVSAVRLTGSPGFSDAELRRQVRLEAGDRFDFIDWQEDRDRLARFYRERGRLAARIGADRVETDAGVELVYELDAGPETSVRIRGAALGGEVVAAIEDAWAESIFDGFLIDETQQIVRNALARDGYLRPAIEVEMTDGGGARTLDVAVEPGVRTRRTDVRVEGVDEPLRSDVADAARPLVDDARGVMAPAEAAGGIAGFLHMRGYASATVTLGAPEFEAETVTLPVIVSPGISFVVGTITFEGVTGLEVDALREDVGLMTGETHDPATVESTRTAVQGRYRREGFTTAVVTVRQQPRPEEEAIDVVFEVSEGPRQTVGEIAISGRRSIDEDVVLRTMDLEVGEPLRAADWLEARQRLFESGLFRRADISLEPLADEATDATAPTGVRVLLEEWPALRLRYGFQVAERYPEEDVNGRDLVPGIAADITRRTLFGRAITLGGAAQYERRERLGRVFLITPTFFGLSLQSSLVAEAQREEPEGLTLVTDTLGLSWEQRVRRGPLALSYGLRFERNHTFDTGPPDPFLGPFDVRTRIGSVTASGAWDTRDDASATTRGTLVSSAVEYGASALGSDFLFVYSLTQAYHFRTWRNVVLASAGRFGVVQGLSGQVVEPSRLFFAGGSRTVRSVAENGLGALDFFGTPTGGRALLVLNQEARVPLFGWLSGVAFIDAGNVFDTPGEVSLGDLTGAWGGGLRVSTPLGIVLRGDYGRTLWGQPEGASRWIFGIGHTF